METPQHILNLPSQDPLTESPGLRNAWQWLAMITMILDHIGYLFDYEPLRWVGRLGMPLYAMLFVISLRHSQVRLGRVVLLAVLSQVPYMYIFQVGFYVGDFLLPQLNIIFGFAIFAWFAEGVRRRQWAKIASGLLMMGIPVSYGWYLYLTMAAFFWLHEKTLQRSAFATLTILYTYLGGFHWRQLLAIAAPFLTWVRAPRPNKYLYRYFYPGHLLILAAVNYWGLGTPLTVPAGRYPYDDYYDAAPWSYYDANDFDDYHEGMWEIETDEGP